MLTLIPTPVGNLQDITLRAIEALKNVDLLLAEDTRTTQKLLAHFEISNRIESFHLHNEHQKTPHYVNVLKSGTHIGLVTDAGTPAISDPGFLLVRAAVNEGIKVCCLPGPTAFVPAIVASGFACERFIYEGFLPHKKGRKKRIEAWINEEKTVVLYESTYRIKKLMEELSLLLQPTRRICIAREISKIYEEFLRGTALELHQHLEQFTPKGEFVVVIEGNNV